jgi:hypothetical protein
MVMSFDLDAGQSLAGHGMDELARRHARTHLHRVQGRDRHRQEARSASRRSPLDQATRYAAEDADVTWRLWTRFKPRLAYERRDARLRDGRPPLIPVVAADGARRDQGRPRAAPAAVVRFAQEIAGWRKRSTPRPGSPSPSARPAARRDPVRQDGPQGRQEGQVRRLFDRRHRARADEGRRRGEDRRAGARLAPAVQAQIDLYRRAAGSRSTATPAASTPATR